jgi:hypothetical protein
MQEAMLDTLHRCAAVCKLRDECTAFVLALASDSAGAICTLHVTLHEGLIPDLIDVGVFAQDPHHNSPQRVKARPTLLSTKSIKVSS